MMDAVIAPQIAGSQSPAQALATRRALDAYASTVRSRSTSAARRIFQPTDNPTIEASGDGGNRNGAAGNSVLIPSLSEESARSMLELNFPVPDLAPFTSYAQGATQTYTGNIYAVRTRLGGLPLPTSNNVDFRI